MNDIRTMVSIRWQLLRMSTKIGITEATLCLLVLLLFQNFTKSATWHSRLSKIKPVQYSENQWDIKDLQKLRNKRQVENGNTKMEYDFEVSEEGLEPPKNIQEILSKKSSKNQKYLQDTMSKLLSKTTNASRQNTESKILQDLSNSKKIDNRQDYDSYPDQFLQKIFKDVTNIQNEREDNYKDVQVDPEKFLWDKNKSVSPIIESVDKTARNTTLLKFARSQNKTSSVDEETFNKTLAGSSSTSSSGSRVQEEKHDDSEKTQSLETNDVYAPGGITEIHLVNSLRAKGLSVKFQAYLNNSLTKRYAWMKNIEKRISILENDFRHIFRWRDKMSSMKNQQESRKRTGKVSKTCRSVKCCLGTSRSNPVRPGREAQKVLGESWRLGKQEPGEEEELDGHFTSASQVKFSELPKNSTEVSRYHEVSSKDDYWDNRAGRPAASSTVQDYRTMRELTEGREHVMSSKNSRGYQSKMAGKGRRNTNKRNNVKELPGYVTRDPEEDDYSHIGRRRILARVGQGSDKHPRELPAEEKRTRGQIGRTESWPKYVTKLRTLALPESLFTNQRSFSKRFQVPIREPRINYILDPPVHKNIQRSVYNRDDNKSQKRITRQRSHSRDIENNSKIMETQIPKPRGGFNLGRIYSNSSKTPLNRTRYTITGRNASSDTYLGDNVKPVVISSSQIPSGRSTMATISKIHESIVPSSYSELSGPAADWRWTLRENTPSWRMFIAGQESRSAITQPSTGSLLAPLVEDHQESQTQESRVQESWNPILSGPLDYYTQG
ncbi:uncharacterized protein LOC107266253 isoform X2 [Cephus cinctus]|nr:uncharacterized protein LOC107266253 isoform X2 [Cephus cinctus]